MEGMGRYGLSYSGEFVDKALEREFFEADMKYYSRIIGPVAIIFGIIYMLFIIADYFAINIISSFLVILIIRVLFLTASISMYFCVRKVKDYYNLSYLLTAYELWAIISFMVIIYQYRSIGFVSLFSVMAITLALYIIPNKPIHTQIITILFNLSFFILFANNIEDLATNMMPKIIAYDLIFIILGNMVAYLTNSYRRKQFAYSNELLRLSITDPLTGLYNRIKFDEELNRWIDYCSRYENPLSLVILDIDDFKRINDTYGHLAGDSVLKNIASVVGKTVRSTDIFARWGGEEFVILLPNTDIRQAMEMTERVRICIQKSKYDVSESLTCSFGLVSLQRSENADSLLQRADKHLYDAKEKGKNAISCELHAVI